MYIFIYLYVLYVYITYKCVKIAASLLKGASCAYVYFCLCFSTA